MKTYNDAGESVADVRFGTDEHSQTIMRKYDEGLLTDVSIGYDIVDYKVEEKPNERDLVTVTSFEIRELSAVGVGFDKGAKQRSQENIDGENPMNKEQMERLRKLEAMTERTAAEQVELTKLFATERAEIEQERKDANAEVERLRAEKVAMVRENEMTALAKTHGVDDATRDAAIAKPELNVDGFVRQILASKVAGSTDTANIQMVDDTEKRSAMTSAIGDVLAERAGIILGDKAHKDVGEFRGATLVDMARVMTGASGYAKEKIVERAMGTADFPNLLLGVGNRVLESEFEKASGTYMQFTKAVDVPDFRENTDIVSGVGGRLDELAERGELVNKEKVEGAEKWAISTFGNKFDITRKMIINDDLGAFTDLLGEFGTMAGYTANGIVYDLLLGRNKYSSYVMADGVAIFHASHANVASGVLDPTTLSAGRLAMRKHKSIDGVSNLNIAAEYLIVGADMEQTAYEIIAATASTIDNKNTGNPNWHQGALTVIVDSEIEADEWFLAASRRTVKVGFLQGMNRRPQLLANNSTLTKTVFEGVFDFGVMAEDYRGLYQGK